MVDNLPDAPARLFCSCYNVNYPKVIRIPSVLFSFSAYLNGRSNLNNLRS